MKKVISTEKVPIKMWLDYLEDGAKAQAKNLANLPGIFKHVAIMPDAHQGYGMPIGGVIAMKDVIIPNAVGVDIGCGMIAVRTDINYRPDTETIKNVMADIRKAIPLGKNRHKESQDRRLMPIIYHHDDYHVVEEEYDSALKQLGTLGGGNHFIELQMGDDGHLWIMIHSGSRNLGYRVANYWNKKAIELNKKWHTQAPPSWQLAYLPLHSRWGQAYYHEQKYCAAFALANRHLMMEQVKECIQMHVKPDVKFDVEINKAHNFAAIENHFGQNVVVHRKGATPANKGDMGIIPGSQGTYSYIVTGLGNKESFNSCSHGAGRMMGRAEAKRKLDYDTEVGKLEDFGVIHSIRSAANLDEASGAYKDISVVMANQTDLVDVRVELRPIAVIKG